MGIEGFMITVIFLAMVLFCINHVEKPFDESKPSDIPDWRKPK